MEKLSWTIRVGPISSHEFLGAESLSWWGKGETCQWREPQGEAVLLDLKTEEGDTSQGTQTCGSYKR